MGIEKFVPYEITAMKRWFLASTPKRGNESVKDLETQYYGRQAIFHTACAVAGYVFANYAARFGINPFHVAAVGVLILPTSAKLAIAGHIVFFNSKAVMEAGRSRQVINLIKALVVASFGYISTTPAFTESKNGVYRATGLWF